MATEPGDADPPEDEFEDETETVAEAVERRGEGPGLPAKGYVPDPAEIDRWTELNGDGASLYYQYRQAQAAESIRSESATQFRFVAMGALIVAGYHAAEELGLF